MRFQYRDATGIRTVTVPSWAMALVGLLAAAAGLTILILGAGLLLILVPVLIVVGVFARWRLRRILREAEARAREGSPGSMRPDVIDVEYRVVDEGRDEPKGPR